MNVYFGEKDFSFSVERADTFLKRFLGLMGKKNLPLGSGLLLVNCKSVHTCFMRFTIDVVYLDKNYLVVGKEKIAPWKCGKYFRNAKYVLEFNDGSADNISIGMSMTIQ